MCDNSDGKFWNEIRKVSPNNIQLPTNIENASRKVAIADMWKGHFKELLNCLKGNVNNNLYSPPHCVHKGLFSGD